MNRVRKTMLLALLSCGATIAATSAMAVTPDPAAGADKGANHSTHFRGASGRGMPGAGIDGPFLHAIQRLNLSSEQQSTIRGYLETARHQSKANAALRPNVEALANPGDPNYLSAIATAKNAAAARIQQHSDLQVQIYGLLTPEQQAKLPQVLSEMKAQQEQRRADKQQRRQQHREPTGVTN